MVKNRKGGSGHKKMARKNVAPKGGYHNRKLRKPVEEGEIFGVIGPNGSGKSTLVNVICGIFLPTEGDVIFEGQMLSDNPTHHRLKKGIARTFQNIRLCEWLAVEQGG